MRGLGENPLHGSVGTENTNKNEDSAEFRSELLRDLPDWLQELKENLVDEIVLAESRGNPSREHRNTSSSSHEFPTESRAKVDRG